MRMVSSLVYHSNFYSNYRVKLTPSAPRSCVFVTYAVNAAGDSATEPLEARPAVDEHKAKEATTVVPAPSAEEEKTTTDEQAAAN